ncbi:hypothetical protein GUJ93_ZPchr0012g21661 [Zizania palustris]|uniref:Uncharacterized protein n=1 Tax=Zizania palustris TaxID=103762 RepID=A0A8J6BSM7_ZIZPA|nr:hypothetical protein GUJ93_ZPchr0012g21661 [Zizania palustris]
MVGERASASRHGGRTSDVSSIGFGLVRRGRTAGATSVRWQARQRALGGEVLAFGGQYFYGGGRAESYEAGWLGHNRQQSMQIFGFLLSGQLGKACNSP